jgi:hypothetical protein
MALKKYVLRVDGKESTVLLSDEDAERYGDAATPVDAQSTEGTKKREPHNKARGTDTK